MKRLIKMITVLSLLVVLGGLPAYAIPYFDAPGLERAMEVQEGHTKALMVNRGVIGTGVGYDAAGGPTIKVFVQTQADVAGLPQALDGVPVVAEVTGMFVARRPGNKGGGGGGGGTTSPANCETDPSDPTKHCNRPVLIGVSTGHPDITAGTIGCRVKDSNGNVYALSNNHVYANINNASLNDAVIQPGSYDGGSSHADDIGSLTDFVTLDFNGGDNIMDAAIASSDANLLGNSTPLDGYGKPSSNIVDASIDLAVKKYGRTTRLTHGTVTTLNATVDVCYETKGPFICSKMARFVNQIIVTPGSFSAGGDSGSLIVTSDNNNPVGLLFAGSSTHTIANPIDPVLEHFAVTVDDGN
ncbi:MAG: hypothetical protein ACU88J_02765 [Gammaproteobacteria bacterium]